VLSVSSGCRPTVEADAGPKSLGNPRGRTFDLVGVMSIVERKGQRREPAADDVRLRSERNRLAPVRWTDWLGVVTRNSLLQTVRFGPSICSIGSSNRAEGGR